MIQPVSWQEIDDCCRELGEKLRTLPPRSLEVVAVCRGGLCPAAMLAYELGTSILTIDFPVMWSSDRSDLLIVDDICDTGQTFEELRLAFPNALYLSLFVKPQGKPLCDYWAREVPQDNWLLFPWARHDFYVGDENE